MKLATVIYRKDNRLQRFPIGCHEQSHATSHATSMALALMMQGATEVYVVDHDGVIVYDLRPHTSRPDTPHMLIF